MSVLRLVVFASMLVTLRLAAAGEPTLRVTATRGLQIAIVDTHAAAAARDDFRRRVLGSLHLVVQRQLGGEFTLRSETFHPRSAAERVQAGACDAVLVFGGSRPRVLRRSSRLTLAMQFGSEGNYEPVYLIVASADERLQQLLTESFPVAVREAWAPGRGCASH